MRKVFFGTHHIFSPFGSGSEQNFEAVQRGHTALSMQQFPVGEFCCGVLPEEEIQRSFDALSIKGDDFTRLEKMCLVSINSTMAQSDFSITTPRTLLIISTTKGNIDVLENPGRFSAERAYLPALGQKIGQSLRCGNDPVIVSNACISGLLGIIIAQRYIQSGRYDHVVVCGADLVTPFTLSGFRSFNALSNEPCRPFDAARNGINLGEAAATIVLSNNASEVTISKGASANDATHISAPSREGSGLYTSLMRILEKNNPAPGFINAHGTATEYNDDMESVAIARAGLNSVPVNSFKGNFGHTLGAAGVLESILSVMSLEKNILLPSRGFSKPGTREPLNVITETRSVLLTSCIKTASGFGGCNAAAIFTKNQ